MRPAAPAGGWLDGGTVRADVTVLPGETGWRAIRFSPVTEEQRLVEELRRGIEAGELVVHYQPKVDLARGTCRGAEALVRWQHPDRGLLFPDQFVPLAERYGLVAALTERVVSDALATGAAWQRAGRPVAVAVNVGPDALARPTFPGRVAQLIQHHGVSPFLFELEVTETAAAERPDDVRTAVEYLKRPFSERQLNRVRSDYAFLLRFLGAAVLLRDDAVFAEFVPWLQAGLTRLGLPTLLGDSLEVLTGVLDGHPAAQRLAAGSVPTLP